MFVLEALINCNGKGKLADLWGKWAWILHVCAQVCTAF